MIALHKEKPDRLPASIHQWQDYHLEEYMGGISDLEAFARFGLDAQIQYFQSMGQFWLVDADFTKFNVNQWVDHANIVSDKPDNRIVHHTIETPEGTLTYRTAGDRKTTWITDYLIKHDEDVELIRKYMPVPQLDPEPIRQRYDEIGDHGILRGFSFPSIAPSIPEACPRSRSSRWDDSWEHRNSGKRLRRVAPVSQGAAGNVRSCGSDFSGNNW